jgi:hypothetical protein
MPLVYFPFKLAASCRSCASGCSQPEPAKSPKPRPAAATHTGASCEWPAPHHWQPRPLAVARRLHCSEPSSLDLGAQRAPGSAAATANQQPACTGKPHCLCQWRPPTRVHAGSSALLANICPLSGPVLRTHWQARTRRSRKEPSITTRYAKLPLANLAESPRHCICPSATGEERGSKLAPPNPLGQAKDLAH